MTGDKDKIAAAEAQQVVAQASVAKAEASATAKAVDELSEEGLEAVAGGKTGGIGGTGIQ